MTRLSFLTLTTSMLLCAGLAKAEELSIEQHVVAEEMRQLVFTKAVAQRLSDLCADFQIDLTKLGAERDRLTDIAKQRFSSGKEFMTAAGADDGEAMGESMRRYFQSRGVKWESSSKDYCALANDLTAIGSPISQYLHKAK